MNGENLREQVITSLSKSSRGPDGIDQEVPGPAEGKGGKDSARQRTKPQAQILPWSLGGMMMFVAHDEMETLPFPCLILPGQICAPEYLATCLPFGGFRSVLRCHAKCGARLKLAEIYLRAFKRFNRFVAFWMRLWDMTRARGFWPTQRRNTVLPT